MSLVGTLAKVAIGVAIAKGVGSMMQQGAAGSAGPGGSAGTGGLFGGPNSPQAANAGAGGLEDIMKSVLGGGAASPGTATRSAGGAASGGLGGLLEQLAGAGGGMASGGSAQGGIGGLLEQLAGGAAGGAGAGGLGDLLGQLTGQGGTSSSSASTGGGLGDLLGGLLGAAGAGAAGGAASNGKSFGDILNTALQTGGEPPVPPTPHQEAAAALLLRAMIQAAKSDGSIDAAEKAKIMQNLKDATPAEIKFVNALVAAPVDVDGLVRAVPKGLESQVYTMSVMAIDLDNQNEANYLHALAQGLGIGQSQVNAIHAQLGVPALYA